MLIELGVRKPGEKDNETRSFEIRCSDKEVLCYVLVDGKVIWQSVYREP